KWMYKKRIRQWGVRKNKRCQMRAIARKTKQPGDQGKPTRIDYKDVVHYRKRKEEVRTDDIIAQRSESKFPEAVDCFISLPSPTVMLVPMAIAERILVSIRDYYKGSFETGTWLATDPRGSCETTKVKDNSLAHLYALREQSMAACMLFANNYFQAAGQNLISATSAIESILLAEHPMTLTCLFVLVAHMFQQRRHEIALSILRQFSALAQIRLGDRHPLRCICGWLASMHPSQILTVIVRCSESTGDNFRDLVGPMNWSTLVSRQEFLHEVDDEHDMGDKTFLLQELLRKCEATLGSLDVRTCEIRLSLAFHYMKNQHHAEAVKLGLIIISHAQYLGMSAAEGLWIIANSQCAMNETCSAEVYLRVAVDLRMAEWGPHDDRARHWLVILDGWLVRQGQLSTAAARLLKYNEMNRNVTRLR
ncbi:MAG: hypothetical protein ALECFALPRED_000967, partial [Alectoria fallacina]